MAFETGVSNSPKDFLDKLGTFAAANGWTVSTGGAGGDPSGSQVSFDDGAGFHLHAIPDNTNGHVRAQPATAYDGSGTLYYAHTGNPAGGSSDVTNHLRMDNIGVGPHTAYFFFCPNSGPLYLHAVVNVSAGIYSHLCFGTMDKFGTFTGGGYATALAWFTGGPSGTLVPWMDTKVSVSAKQWVRADGFFGSATVPDWHDNFGAHGWRQGLGTTSSFTYPLYRGGLIELTQRSPLIPNYMRLESGAGDPDQNIWIGHTPDLRMVIMDGRQPGEILTIGSDQWYIFPARVKGAEVGFDAFNVTGTGPNHTTNQIGFAYRRID